jgi:hypothetical protein
VQELFTQALVARHGLHLVTYSQPQLHGLGLLLAMTCAFLSQQIKQQPQQQCQQLLELSLLTEQLLYQLVRHG